MAIAQSPPDRRRGPSFSPSFVFLHPSFFGGSSEERRPAQSQEARPGPGAGPLDGPYSGSRSRFCFTRYHVVSLLGAAPHPPLRGDVRFQRRSRSAAQYDAVGRPATQVLGVLGSTRGGRLARAAARPGARLADPPEAEWLIARGFSAERCIVPAQPGSSPVQASLACPPSWASRRCRAPQLLFGIRR